jgi:hypothetical protein
MSPKASRPAGAPDDEPAAPDPDLPPGYVKTSRPKPGPEPVSWWLKSTGLVVLLAAATIAIWAMFKDPDPRESARGTTALVAEALTDADIADFRSYVCDSDKLDIPDSWMQMGTTTMDGVSDEHDGVATGTLRSSKRPEIYLAVPLRSKDEQWCVVAVAICPLYLDAPAASHLPDVPGCRDRPYR